MGVLQREQKIFNKLDTIMYQVKQISGTGQMHWDPLGLRFQGEPPL
jgi:hypothetical protein